MHPLLLGESLNTSLQRKVFSPPHSRLTEAGVIQLTETRVSFAAVILRPWDPGCLNGTHHTARPSLANRGISEYAVVPMPVE